MNNNPDAARFAGKSILITGAASGIGQRLAERFTACGARVAIVDIDGEGARRIADSLPGAIALTADLSQPEATRQVVHDVVDALGGIDVLVNNAATCADSPFEELSDLEWERDLAVDLSAPFRLTQECVPALSQRGGVVLNIVSVNALQYYGNESYSAAKAALISLTRSLAVRLGPRGIRVTAIAPGTIVTPIWDERLALDPGVLDKAQRWYPLGRLGTPDDVANASLFLCSADASWITGTTLVVDGGLTAGNAVMAQEIVPAQ
ncbi:SDR family NAD(P)-dependent oxidoreductase [Microbacterium lushaniae]|uniref:SDR family oxidoreductase n=1 Tax=Microbacterium lushaniae TaxID=2614639 RepID=A0A5J6L3N2_9MICO|nr:SDR family NAD(P)-dependent oxidoreductase [Microbacterium lushaniae]QEW03080.1 SDR family oxidoreductase [Microbacterium lushaniae]